MKKIAHYFKTTERSKGQALILIAITFVALLGFVGLTTDVGMLFINYGHLRRGVDAAALAAAAQIREGRTGTQIVAAAEQALHVNGVYDTIVEVYQCQADSPIMADPALCPDPGDPPVKLVRIVANAEFPLAFLHVIGARSAPLTAEAVAEAAALDVVLVIDVSQSMADEGPTVYGGGYTATEAKNFKDPSQCNLGTPRFSGDQYCQPMAGVKDAAEDFAENILNLPEAKEADRLAIVTFSNGWETGGTTDVIPGWTFDSTVAVAAIQALNVYGGYECPNPPGSTADLGNCREYDGTVDNNFVRWRCNTIDAYISGMMPNEDYSTCPTTNIGGGMLVAASLFGVQERPSALKVVVLLTDGTNNASSAAPDDCESTSTCTVGYISSNLPFGYCPQTPGMPQCRDDDAEGRHVPSASYPNCPPALHETNPGDDLSCPALYDADDYARDVADFVGCLGFNPDPRCPAGGGQGAIIFTIGMGDILVSNLDDDGKPYGATLLRYIASVGDDGVPDFDEGRDQCETLYVPGQYEEDCGNYFYIQNVLELPAVFEKIASRIFTRIAR